MKFFISILIFLLPATAYSQQTKIVFKPEKISAGSGFKMDDYWVWGGSAIKVGSTYHLFASRWKRTGPFPEGYRQGSEIVRASSPTPSGPFRFEEVVIGERDSSFWDSNMAHNPTIHKIGNEYVLYYIGSDFTTMNKNSKNLLRRIGYATATSIEGPWKRCDNPVIDFESNNPAILQDGNTIKLLFRDNELKVIMAEADSYKGPFRIINKDVWPDCKLEDFYLFKNSEGYHIICEDNVGGVSGHERWGVHLISVNGIDSWKKYEPVIAYDHDILFRKDSVLHCVRRERPQLLIVNNKITYLYNGVYDGKNSWCQPVKLRPVRLR